METVSKTLKEQVITDVGRFSFASIVAQVCVFFRSYFGAHILGPNVWGIWATGNLIQNYAGFTNLGVIQGMHREIPILRGKGDSRESAKIRDTAFSFNFLVGTFVAAIIFIITFLIKAQPELLLALRFISILLFFNSLAGSYSNLFRANNRFNLVSRITVIGGIISLLSIILIFRFSFAGFLTGQVVAILIVTIYCIFNYREKIIFQIDIKMLKTLIIIGFPIMLLSIAGYLFVTADRLLIVSVLGYKNLGIYSVTRLVSMPIMLICSTGSIVMYPRLAEKFGSTGELKDLKKYIVLPIKDISMVVPIMMGIIYVALPILIKIFLPKYIGAILPAQILLFGFFFRAIVGIAGNFLIATNRQVRYLGIMLFSAFINLIVSFAMIKLGFGIVGVAIGTSLSYFVYFSIAITTVMNYCEAGKDEIIKLFSNVLFPVLYTAIISFFINNLVNTNSPLISHQILETIIKLIIFFVLSSFLIYRAFKNSDIMLIAKGIFRKNKSK